MYLAPTMTSLTDTQWVQLNAFFGKRLQKNVSLARFTGARVGGPADCLLVANSVSELVEAARALWDMGLPFIVLGGGSNVLVSDAGVRGVVVLNRAKETEIDKSNLSVWAGSGASFGSLARRVSARNLSGLEWAVGIPGTVGGAVFGNAGAHGSDVSGCLMLAEILHQINGRLQLTPPQMGYAYRSSALRRDPEPSIILSAHFKLGVGNAAETKALVEKFTQRRKKTQPPGASLGSMFKNPPGDYAGRLIEQAGLKGTRIGRAVISPVHANFFINDGGTLASDIFSLIQLTQKAVMEKFGVQLELEIKLIGEWEGNDVR
jgi:UDP-N-acetylmuramate dehydrogenase